MKVNISIKRYNGEKHYISSFQIDITDRTTVLEGLAYIKDYIDPTLTFRYQCRSAICGTCAVKVGEKHILACKTKIKEILNEKNEVLIEPVSNLPVIKDLVVNQDIFLDKLKLAKSWFVPKDNFQKVLPKDLEEFDRETNCILCGICYSACPVFQTSQNFGGPINFVKIYRFWKDRNDKLNDNDERIRIAVNSNFITNCIHCKYCTFQCPKEIPVELDIMKIEFYAKQKGYIKEQEDFGSFNFGGGGFFL